MFRTAAVTLLMMGTIQAQTLTTKHFGSGANEFSMDFVEIGNPGNAADPAGIPSPAGSVAYVYNLGRYEVSREMINKANASAGLGISMTDMSSLGGNGANRPANGISWFEAARFVNWLNTSSGSSAAYKFDANGGFQLWSPGDAGYNAANPFRNSLASFWLPNVHEWYKAAYGSPDPANSWFLFPNGSNLQPAQGTGAVYGQLSGDPSETGPVDVHQAGSLSAWGTMGQGGNVAEWMENAFDGANDSTTEPRELRGGSWVGFPSFLQSNMTGGAEADREGLATLGDAYVGFRVAGVPEPTSFSLLLASGVALIALRRRKGGKN